MSAGAGPGTPRGALRAAGRADASLPSVAEVLGRHEALLHAAGTAVDVAVVRDRSLSVGVAVPPDAPYIVRAAELEIPTVRRGSGGTAILHLEGDLAWAVVLPRADPRVGRTYTRAYASLGEGIVAALASLGIEAAWVPAPGLADDYCSLSSRGEVLAAGGRVLGGAAQHVTSSALLHHGGISWRVDRPLVERVFRFPSGAPAARLAGVVDLAPEVDGATFARTVRQALADRLAG